MLSRVFLINQNKCCARKCLMCPYEQKHSGKSSVVRKEIIEDLDEWELKQIKNVRKLNINF